MTPWHCAGTFSSRKRTGMRLILHARTKHLFGLREDARDLVQTRDVVLVLLHRIQGNGERQIGEMQLRAAIWLTGISYSLKPMVLDALLERARQDLVRQRVLLREPCHRDRFQARKKPDRARSRFGPGRASSRSADRYSDSPRRRSPSQGAS